jgi:hypothetical protein
MVDTGLQKGYAPSMTKEVIMTTKVAVEFNDEEIELIGNELKKLRAGWFIALEKTDWEDYAKKQIKVIDNTLNKIGFYL